MPIIQGRAANQSNATYGQIDFRKQVIMMLPPVVRRLTMVDWLHSLVHPLDTLMTLDWKYIYDQYIKGHLTGQKMVMQEGLNFLFNITAAPWILIETVRREGETAYMYNEAEVASDMYIYNEAELPAVTWILNEAEATPPGGDTVDFIVKIPTQYATQENLDRLDQQVALIKLVGTTYKIVTY